MLETLWSQCLVGGTVLKTGVQNKENIDRANLILFSLFLLFLFSLAATIKKEMPELLPMYSFSNDPRAIPSDPPSNFLEGITLTFYHNTFIKCII